MRLILPKKVHFSSLCITFALINKLIKLVQSIFLTINLSILIFLILLIGAKSSERVEKGEIFSGNRNELKRDDVIMGSNLYSPPQLFGTNKKYQDNINPFLTPQNEALDLNMKKAQQYRNNVNTISTDHTKQSASLSSAFNSMVLFYYFPLLLNVILKLSNFQNKIQKHIADINECALNQQVKLDTEVNNTLKNMGSFTNPKDIEKKLELSFGFTEKKINQAKLQKKNEKNSKIFNIINNNVSSEISMRKDFESFVKDGSRVDCSYIMEKMKNNPTKPQFEGSNINENILKKLEILQNSLSLSEREAVICMLMEDLDHNSKQHNVNFEDLMAVPHPNDKISSIISNNMYPRSISKVRDQSANSVFRCEVSHIKGSYHPQSESIAQSPHHIEPVFSPEFYSKKKPENRNLQQIITTPNAEKADLFHYLSRYVSPQPGVEVDINIQNMDLGSFIVNHEDIPHKDFETPGMKGLMEKLGKDVISPIVAKEKVGNVVREINQGKYAFPTSVEKEYGRKIGGALDFNDKFLMEFDSKSTDEDRVNTSEERKRLPTAEDTKYVEKGDDLDLQHPIYQVLGKDIEKEGKREKEERQKPKGSENRFIRMFPFKICGANKNGK